MTTTSNVSIAPKSRFYWPKISLTEWVEASLIVALIATFGYGVALIVNAL